MSLGLFAGVWKHFPATWERAWNTRTFLQGRTSALFKKRETQDTNYYESREYWFFLMEIFFFLFLYKATIKIWVFADKMTKLRDYKTLWVAHLWDVADGWLVKHLCTFFSWKFGVVREIRSRLEVRPVRWKEMLDIERDIQSNLNDQVLVEWGE